MSLISIDFTGSGDALARVCAEGREDDFAYHQRRAEEELAIAQQAAHPAVRRFRYHLAALHLDRAHAEVALQMVDNRKVA